MMENERMGLACFSRWNTAVLLVMAALILVLFAVASPQIVAAQQIDTTGKQAIIIDMTTGAVLFDKNADAPMPPASMSKLMTVYMIFYELKKGRLNLDDKFRVSVEAWRKGGSKMFVMVNTRIKIRDLLRGIIVQSGNDACIVIAEGMSGSEEAFADAMTKRAKEIGLTNSVFKNSTGWPAEGQHMSARDLATLSAKLIQEFPEYYGIFAEKSFVYGGIRQGNRNPLLYKESGSDGLKTGHTEASGYGLTASALRNGRRLILVLNGLTSKRKRSSEALRLLDWAFRETASYALFKKGDTIDHADVWLGVSARVPLVAERSITVTLPRRMRRNMKVKVVYKSPIPAPVGKGTAVGKVIISTSGRADLEMPVVAGEAVDRLGVFGRLNATFKYLLWGKS
ncbi:D-alanyl-D-alanine carboxypeptidase [Alphaproteobacteria bacterium]|nr:D-alanyl-D-alanine carboxypeptidase [Alphaproteobacteria bacterium]